MLWRADIGTVELQVLLDDIGVVTDGWDPHRATAASYDGLSVVGYGNFMGQRRAFLVRGLPLPTSCRADLDGDGSLTIFDCLAFQNLFDAGDLAADFDGDDELTIFDFLAFQNAFDAGCE